MATYTIQLRHIVATFGEEEVKSWFMDYDLRDYLTDEEIAVITARGTWDKEKLAKMIIQHYEMREIGFETPSYFMHKAKTLMREIMEEKAPLIYSTAIKYDPLVNVDYTETYKEDSSGKSQSTSSNSGNGLNINSDTPQGQINKNDILQGRYASSTSASESSNSINDNSQSSGTQNYTKNIRGNSGVSATAQAMVRQYRQNIIMINHDIIDACASLFMNIY